MSGANALPMGEDAHPPIHEGNFIWFGTDGDLSDWKEYKRSRAAALLNRGYSVEWHPDARNTFDVYVARRPFTTDEEIRASVQFYSIPSSTGLHGGKIIRLLITSKRELVPGSSDRLANILYEYDRAPLVDQLMQNLTAQTLYQAIVDEMN